MAVFGYWRWCCRDYTAWRKKEQADCWQFMAGSTYSCLVFGHPSGKTAAGISRTGKQRQIDRRTDGQKDILQTVGHTFRQTMDRQKRYRRIQTETNRQTDKNCPCPVECFCFLLYLWWALAAVFIFTLHANVMHVRLCSPMYVFICACVCVCIMDMFYIV